MWRSWPILPVALAAKESGDCRICFKRGQILGRGQSRLVAVAVDRPLAASISFPVYLNIRTILTVIGSSDVGQTPTSR
jgi:hypothetical protein